jgi:hypothetical protein
MEHVHDQCWISGSGAGRNNRTGLAKRKLGAIAIRPARDEADIAAMMDLGRVLHAESRYRAHPLDDGRGKQGQSLLFHLTDAA